MQKKITNAIHLKLSLDSERQNVNTQGGQACPDHCVPQTFWAVGAPEKGGEMSLCGCRRLPGGGGILYYELDSIPQIHMLKSPNVHHLII